MSTGTLLAQPILLLVLIWILRRIFFVKTANLDNIPGPKSNSFFTGNLAQMFNPSSGWEFNSRLSAQYGRVSRIHGAFGAKLLMVYDPKALHHILVKDQAIYEETSTFFASNKIVFGMGLLSTQGEQHRRQRKMLNPVFSIAYMRNMVPLFNDIARKIEKAIKLKLVDGAQEIDILQWMSRAALEMIGQSGFGYSFDPLVEGAEPHPFCEAAKSFSPTMNKLAIEQHYLLPTLVKIGSPKFRRWFVDHLPIKRLRDVRDVVDTMHRTAVEIFEDKKRVLQEENADGEALKEKVGNAKDLMSILMKANMDASEEDKLPDEEVLGQMSTFTFAATDTTSNALSRTLHLLALHPEAQERLRAEVVEARKVHAGDIPYDDLVSLPFLDAICRETLRLHAPVPNILRVARQDIVLPLSTPIKGIDGSEMNSILVPKDTEIFVGILNANRDPLLWGPDALEWRPERWLKPLPNALLEAPMPGIYSHLLTFIGGSRACIGFKFSQLEMKVVLATLISQFSFSPPRKEIAWQMSGITNPALQQSPGTPQLPLKMELVSPTV